MLTGAGGHFCAGADLKAVGDAGAATGSSPTATARWARPGCGCRKPVIAAIEGYAVAGGLELALWADLRVAVAGRRPSASSAAAGACRSIDGGTVRLPRLIGAVPRDGPDPDRAGGAADRRRSRWGWSTGSASRARRWPGASDSPQQLAALPQTCLRQDRLSVLEQWGLDEEAALAAELAHGLVSLQADALAGAARFAAGGAARRAEGRRLTVPRAQRACRAPPQ